MKSVKTGRGFNPSLNFLDVLLLPVAEGGVLSSRVCYQLELKEGDER